MPTQTERTPTQAEQDLVHQVLADLYLTHENPWVRQMAARVVANEEPNNGLDTLREVATAQLRHADALETEQMRAQRAMQELGLSPQAVYAALRMMGHEPPNTITCSSCNDIMPGAPHIEWTCSYCAPRRR